MQGVEFDKLKLELSSLKERLTGKEEELGRAEENTEALRRKLEETADMLRTNENGRQCRVHRCPGSTSDPL